jgi:uncharacterized protein YbjT (DUF2867 family)
MTRPIQACLSATIFMLTAALAGAQHNLTGELPQPSGAAPAREIVLVAGATGRTGRLVIEQLQADPRFEARAMARDPARAAREVGSSHRWIAGDVTRPDTLAAAMRGASYVICAIGATQRSGPNGPEFVDYGGVRNLADAARAAGVRQFVLISSIGAGGEGGFTRWILNLIGGDVLVWKAKGEAYLRSSGVAYTIVRPGGLRDGPGGREGLRFMQGDTETGDITRADTAAVAIAALANADATNKTFEVVADEAAKPGAWRQGFAALKRD